MKEYLLSVYIDENRTPSPEEMEAAYRDADAFNGELQEAGAWVFAGGWNGRTSMGARRATVAFPAQSRAASRSAALMIQSPRVAPSSRGRGRRW